MPVSTYRLQFGPRFRLTDAIELVPYLAQLGITHVYASPLLKARPGSEHGYDITDHNAINPEIGTWDDFVGFTDALRAQGMGLILDFVPNHMGIGKADNDWWLDVLEAGQGSAYADFFDITWAPGLPELRGKVLLPILGGPYGTVLTGGELVLRFDAANGTLSVWYHDHRLPLRARSYAAVIRRQLSRTNGPHFAETLCIEFARIADAFDRVRRTGRRREEARQRAAELKRELVNMCRSSTEALRFMESAASSMNGTAGDPDSFRPLHALLERQFYRLAYWRVAADEINYRRFFNINELAGVRMENRALFDAAHALLGRMMAEGRLDGLRLDHVDGLFDPEGYCRRLQSFAAAHSPRGARARRPFYIVVEKILARHESLRAGWQVAGTTGYKFANLLNGIFVSPRGEEGCTAAYADFAGPVPSFDEVALNSKYVVMETMLSAELGVLADMIDRISERHWDTRDYTRQRLRDALRTVVAHLTVYRTYVTSRGARGEDRRDIDWAVGRTRRDWQGPDREILDFVHDALTADLAERGKPFRRADVVRFAMRFQQYTGPVMAKSVEDTAFYRHHRLIALNEVGGDPRQFGVSVGSFHAANRERLRHSPHAMVATSTHDTKRGEDARLRIDAISEIPEEWQRRVARWAELNRALRGEADDAPAPSANDEYLLYQALLGAWPAAFIAAVPDEGALREFSDRMERFFLKAIREAKLSTSWDNPNRPYEEACIAFVRNLLGRSPNPFLADFADFAAGAAFFAMLSGVSQTVLRLTAPGVPDTFQGTEIWNFSLVDPDNRAPVDFAALRRLQKDMPDSGDDVRACCRELLECWPDGRIKFHLANTLLKLRRRETDLYLEGDYQPLGATGAREEHLVAFARSRGNRKVVVLAGRLFVGLLGWDATRYDCSAWRDTSLTWPAELHGFWRDVLTGEPFDLTGKGKQPQLGRLLAIMPAAVLVSERGGKRR